jgi:hypothetical protein
MIGKFTFWLTALAVAVCLYHLSGLDHGHVVLYHVSVPAWIIPIFTSIQTVNKYLLYFLTIASWFVIGLALDALVARVRDGQGAR